MVSNWLAPTVTLSEPGTPICHLNQNITPHRYSLPQDRTNWTSSTKSESHICQQRQTYTTILLITTLPATSARYPPTEDDRSCTMATRTRSPTGFPDPTSINLNRLLSRLEHIVLAEPSSLLRKSSYERARVSAVSV